MVKSELLATLKTERAKLERNLKAIGADRVHIAGVSGSYSTKDIMAHLEAYDRALIIWLVESRAGRAYVDPVLGQPNLDARNAVIYYTNKDKSANDSFEHRQQHLPDIQHWLIEQGSVA